MHFHLTKIEILIKKLKNKSDKKAILTFINK